MWTPSSPVIKWSNLTFTSSVYNLKADVNNICRLETLLSHLSHVTWMQRQCYRMWLLSTNWHSVILHILKSVFTDIVWSCQRLSGVFTCLPAVNITAGQQLKSENWCRTQEGAFILLTRDVVEVKAPPLSLSAVLVKNMFLDRLKNTMIIRMHPVIHHGKWCQSAISH